VSFCSFDIMPSGCGQLLTKNNLSDSMFRPVVVSG